MKALLILIASIMAATVIGLTACESLYDDYFVEYKVVYLFRTDSTQYPASMGGRAGTDAICAATYAQHYQHFGATNIRAFINVSVADQISQMPENFGVPVDVPVLAVRDDTYQIGNALGSNWFDILDGSISDTLMNIGIITGGTVNIWTGDISGHGTTSIDGSYNCHNWTSAISANGAGGRSDSNGTGWLASGSALGCANNYYFLCVAW